MKALIIAVLYVCVAFGEGLLENKKLTREDIMYQHTRTWMVEPSDNSGTTGRARKTEGSTIIPMFSLNKDGYSIEVYGKSPKGDDYMMTYIGRAEWYRGGKLVKTNNEVLIVAFKLKGLIDKSKDWNAWTMMFIKNGTKETEESRISVAATSWVSGY